MVCFRGDGDGTCKQAFNPRTPQQGAPTYYLASCPQKVKMKEIGPRVGRTCLEPTHPPDAPMYTYLSSKNSIIWWTVSGLVNYFRWESDGKVRWKTPDEQISIEKLFFSVFYIQIWGA